jgi:hypothetical protein
MLAQFALAADRVRIVAHRRLAQATTQRLRRLMRRRENAIMEPLLEGVHRLMQHGDVRISRHGYDELSLDRLAAR